MPVKDLGNESPAVAHLAALKNSGWDAMPPGTWMFYRSADPNMPPITFLLAQVKPTKGGVKLVGLCCNNPKCTRRITLEGTWNGRHFAAEMATPGHTNGRN